MYLEYSKELEERVYKGVRESLLDSKCFRRRDHDLRLHLVYDDCEKCNNKKDCKIFDNLEGDRFRTIYELMDIYLDDERNLISCLTSVEIGNPVVDRTMSPEQRLLNNICRRIDNDVALYEEIYCLNEECSYPDCSFGEERCRNEKRVMNALKTLFCD